MSVAGLLHRRGMMGKAAASVLPTGYRAVNGLKVNPSQKAGLDMTCPTMPFVVVLEVTILSYLPVLSSGFSCLFGRDGNLQLGYIANGYANVGNSQSNVVLPANTKCVVEACFDSEQANTYYYIDNVDTTLKRAFTSSTITILGSTSSSYLANAVIHSMKLYHGGNKFKDFIPCENLSNGTFGFWDAVNNEFIVTPFVEYSGT